MVDGFRKHLDRSEGHIKGYQNIKSITLMAKKLGVKYLTLLLFQLKIGIDL